MIATEVSRNRVRKGLACKDVELNAIMAHVRIVLARVLASFVFVQIVVAISPQTVVVVLLIFIPIVFLFIIQF
jgi:hypothetical protein